MRGNFDDDEDQEDARKELVIPKYILLYQDMEVEIKQDMLQEDKDEGHEREEEEKKMLLLKLKEKILLYLMIMLLLRKILKRKLWKNLELKICL